jgi:hypothetical protein
MVTGLGAYILMTCKCIGIIDNNKRMFFWTRLCLVICAVIQNSEEYIIIDACIEAVFGAKTALHFDPEYNKAFISGPKDEVPKNA